jgi:hypothetical protein
VSLVAGQFLGDFLPDHKCQEFGVLSLCPSEVDLAVKSEKLGEGGVAHSIEKTEFPAEGSRRESHCTQRMTGIVLTVPKRALAILPSFAPKNRREPYEE